MGIFRAENCLEYDNLSIDVNIFGLHVILIFEYLPFGYLEISAKKYLQTYEH